MSRWRRWWSDKPWLAIGVIWTILILALFFWWARVLTVLMFGVSLVLWFRAWLRNEVCSCDGHGPGGTAWHLTYCERYCTCRSCTTLRDVNVH